MNELVIKDENIENMIYEIRGKQVIVDKDIAKLYGVETRVLNQSVKRNITRFPEEFCFQMTNEEFENWKSQIVTSNSNKMGLRKKPFVFTEQGVAMLSSVLSSSNAINTSILIINAFVKMRKYISIEMLNNQNIEKVLIRHDVEIKQLQESFEKFEEKKKINEIYYEGQIYDAYSKILDILSMAKKEVIIVDAYADKSVLDIIRKLNTKVVLICKTNGLIKRIDIEKYNKQYGNLKVVYNDSFHDRYFIIDKTQVYHCGTSINHAGSKTFSINIIEDNLVKDRLIEYVNKIS